MNTNEQIDSYINKSQPFAQPILTELRNRIHASCPDVEETIKWQFPNFMYKGKILCSIASFKNHCSFGFWLSSLMENTGFNRDAMGDFGKLTSLEQLPPADVFRTMVLEAMELIDAGKTVPRTPIKKTSLEIPQEITEALNKNETARRCFEAFSPSQQKEYAEWILEAKTEVTKSKRLETMLEWVSEGKPRHWKYQSKK